MAQVTIEGSKTTPSDRLARGERRTVEVTDDIRQLVRIGAVIVVEGSLDAAPAAPVVKPKRARKAKAVAPASIPDPEPAPDAEPETDSVPEVDVVADDPEPEPEPAPDAS